MNVHGRIHVQARQVPALVIKEFRAVVAEIWGDGDDQGPRDTLFVGHSTRDVLLVDPHDVGYLKHVVDRCIHEGMVVLELALLDKVIETRRGVRSMVQERRASEKTSAQAGVYEDALWHIHVACDRCRASFPETKTRDVHNRGCSDPHGLRPTKS